MTLVRNWIATLAIAMILTGCLGSGGDIVVQFDRAYGIEVGDPVLASDLEIGKVSRLDLNGDGSVLVSLQIDGQHRGRMTEESEVWLRRRGFLLTDRKLEVVVKEGKRVSEGHVYAGRTNRDKVDEWVSGLAGLIDDPELEQRTNELRESMEELAQKGRDEWDRMKPELERQVEEMLEEADRQGAEIVDELSQELEKLIEELEREVETRSDDGVI